MTDSENHYEVVMPKLGLTMTEATIVEWHKTEGEHIEKDEVLFTLETEKTSLDIEAPVSGAVHILYPQGETVPVQSVIATIEGDISQLLRERAPVAEANSSLQEIRATPKARKAARKLGVSLVGLSGSGPRDMVVVADVEAALDAQAEVRATPVARRVAEHMGVDLTQVAGTGSRGMITRADVEQSAGKATDARESTAIKDVSPPMVEEAQPLTGLRAIIAERMSTGWQERPQVTVNTEVDATNLVSARQQLNAELAAFNGGEKVSYNAFILKAVARALQELPYLNVQLTEDGLVHMPNINVGLAVDTDRGLLVPVVRDADKKDLLTVNQVLLELAQRAVAGQCLPDELSGGTFTVTNLGMYDVDDFTPIINPPESAILGVGRITPKPVVWEGQITIRPRMTLSLSFDHRLIDGAPAARFLQRVKQLIERPIVLVSRN